MPPTGKLKDEEIEALKSWVKMGTPWPDTKATATPSPGSNDKYTRQIHREGTGRFSLSRTILFRKVKDQGWIRTLCRRFYSSEAGRAGSPTSAPCGQADAAASRQMGSSWTAANSK